MANLRNWIPLPRPTPIKTLPKRFIGKLLWIAKEAIFIIGLQLGLLGASNLGVNPNGNTRLRLNKDYPLGCKGTVLELPKDRVIYEWVKRAGLWEIEMSEFLALGLKQSSRKFTSNRIALLDIGANTGLVTLQAMNLSNSSAEAFLFEPIPRHADAIKQNLGKFSNIHINEFGLSDRDGQAEIFTDANNHGNTSLFNSVIPETNTISTQIRLVDTTAYCNEFLQRFSRFVIKCDAQGMDALILARIPSWIWKNCELAVVEVLSINEINKMDVEALLSMWQEFEYVSWRPDLGKERIRLSEVRDFWLSASGSERNLFLSRSLHGEKSLPDFLEV
jgi:FkbM family methyltransferase